MESDRPVVDAFVEFAEALSRLESVSMLYPAEHARSRDTAALLRTAIQKLSGTDQRVSLEIGDERLMVGAVSIPLTTRVAQGLHSELECLGLARLEIDAGATTDDLHQLAGSLRAVAQRILTTHSLQVVDFSDLPASIRVRHREFGRRVGKGVAAAGSAQTLDRLVESACAPLGASSLDSATRSACQEWVKKSMRRIVERVEHSIPFAAPNSPDVPRRPLDDVLQLAGQTLERALSEFLSSAGGQSDLQRMFQSIEMATAVCEDPESARLMVEVLRESAEEVLRDSDVLLDLEAEDVELEAFQMTLADLHRRLEELKPAIDQMSNMEREDRSESLAIVLATLPCITRDVQGARIVGRLRAMTSAPLTRPEKQTLLCGIQALCAGDDELLIDRVLPRISAALGDDLSELWLSAAIQTAEASPPEGLAPLWPHLASELLRGPRSTTDEHLARAMTQVGRLPKELIEAGMKRLGALPPFLGGTISRYAFASVRDDLAHFHLALLRSRRSDVVGGLLLESVKARAPAWLGGVVFQTFARFDTSCRDLMCALLQGGGLNQPDPETQLIAGNLIAQRLASLASERGSEAWVPRAIEALGSVRTAEAERALRRILEERKHLVMPLWTHACRAAARRALADHERGSRAGNAGGRD